MCLPYIHARKTRKYQVGNEVGNEFDIFLQCEDHGAFYNFLSSEYAIENLLFYDRADLVLKSVTPVNMDEGKLRLVVDPESEKKETGTTTNNATIWDEFHFLWDAYIREGADHQINIPHGLRVKIRDILNNDTDQGDLTTERAVKLKRYISDSQKITKKLLLPAWARFQRRRSRSSIE